MITPPAVPSSLPRLPHAVIQQGILIEEASSAVLQIITLQSTDGKLDEIGLGDFSSICNSLSTHLTGPWLIPRASALGVIPKAGPK
jgi:hypothetical protein